MVLTSGVVYANFAPQLELSDLNGTNGFVINGRESMTIQAHPSARLVISMAMVSVIWSLVPPYAITGADSAGASYVVYGAEEKGDEIFADSFE